MITVLLGTGMRIGETIKDLWRIILEPLDESGLTQEDFVKRLDTTPKNLSLLIRGEQSLSIDIAMKLSMVNDRRLNADA